jgi:hypothetical protein
MSRTAALETSLAENAQAVTIRISDVVGIDEIPEHLRSTSILQTPSLQQKVSQIRTDLNRFSSAEIRALHRHGYELAVARLGTLTKWRPSAMNTWNPTSSRSPHFADFSRWSKHRTATAQAALDGRALPPPPDPDSINESDLTRRGFLGLWDIRDPFSWLLALELLVALALGIALSCALKLGLADLINSIRPH